MPRSTDFLNCPMPRGNSTQTGRNCFVGRLSRLPFVNLDALERRGLSRLSTMPRCLFRVKIPFDLLMYHMIYWAMWSASSSIK